MGRRGFLAEVQRQIRIANREAARSQLAREKQRRAAIRDAERAAKEEERFQTQLERATATERKRLEKEARQKHVAAREADVERRNLDLAAIHEDLAGLLAATLSVDDYVDLDDLKADASNPPFDHPSLESTIQFPGPLPDLPRPAPQLPEPPRGILAFLQSGKHKKAVAAAEAAHRAAQERWTEEIASLRSAWSRYESECTRRAQDVERRNNEVERLKANLGYGVPEAVDEYISIVLSNSVYPDHFPIDHDFQFNPDTAELRLRVLVPAPSSLPTAKVYRYKKAADEITETALSQKAVRDLYASAVHQVALRSVHEVFEADRRGLIRTVSLEVGTQTANPATGVNEFIPFVIGAAEREAFLALELGNVVPIATLRHLGAAVSQNPHSLLPVDGTGIRRS